MRLSRLDVLVLVAGLGGMGACRGGPPPEPAESAAAPTTPAESTVSQAAAAAPPPAAGAAATGAAMVTLNFVLKASMRSASSITVLLPIASRISSLLSVVGISLSPNGPVGRGTRPCALRADRFVMIQRCAGYEALQERQPSA